MLGFVAVWIAHMASKTLESMPIVIKKAKSADKEVIGFYVAYVLPLVLRGVSTPDLLTWIFAALMLFLVLWGTHAMQVNPVLGLIGFHFYEIEAEGGIGYLLITRRQISNIMTIKKVVQLSEYGILEADHSKDGVKS